MDGCNFRSWLTLTSGHMLFSAWYLQQHFVPFSLQRLPSYLLTPLLLQEALQPATGSHVVWVLQLSGRTGSQTASLSVRRALPQGRRLQTGQYKTSDRSVK